MLLWLNLVANLLLCVVIVHRSKQYIKWGISKRFYTRIDTLKTTGHYRRVVIEILIGILGPYEFFRGINIKEHSSQLDYSYEVPLNTWLCLASLLKIFFWMRAIMHLSKFTDPRSQRVC